MDDLGKEEQKEIMKAAFKEASKEYLEELAAKFGRMSAKSIAGVLVVSCLYFILITHGWKMPA